MDKIIAECNLCNLKGYKNRLKSAFKRLKRGYCTNCTNCVVAVYISTHIRILILNNIINIYILSYNIAICAIWLFLILLGHYFTTFNLYKLHGYAKGL